MSFDNQQTLRPQCGPMNPEGAELAIAQFLAASRRYLDLEMPAKGAPRRPDGEAPASALAEPELKRSRRSPPDYRNLLSSVLLASTLGLGGVSSSFASVHSAPRSGAPGKPGPRLPAAETPPQKP